MKISRFWKTIFWLNLTFWGLGLEAYADIYSSSCVIENASGADLSEFQTFFDIGDACRREVPRNSSFILARFTTIPYKIESIRFRNGSVEHETKFNPTLVVLPYERIRLIVGPGPDYPVKTRRSRSILAMILPLERDNRFYSPHKGPKVINIHD